MSGSSYWPMSAVYVHGTAPLSRIQATATEVSRPPEKAMPTRSPTGRDVSTLDTRTIMHDCAWSCGGGSGREAEIYLDAPAGAPTPSLVRASAMTVRSSSRVGPGVHGGRQPDS